MYLAIGLLLIGFILLLKGADWFVNGASDIAKAFGVSEFIIGLTLVAFGTSVPELASSIAAAITGSSQLIVGNVFGSNIANIALILGIAAMLAPVIPEKIMFYREGYILLAITALLGVMFFFGAIALWQSAFLLLLYAAYVLFLFEDMEHHEQPFRKFIKYFARFGYVRTALGMMGGKQKKRKPWLHHVPRTIIGLIAVILGARWLVDGSITIASSLGMSEGMIGATIVALGTSLPELLVTITAARGGMANLAIGNVIGSNIGNTLLILGISGLITPLHWEGLILTFGFMVLVTILLMFFIKSTWKLRRMEGVIFLCLYLAFLVMTTMSM